MQNSTAPSGICSNDFQDAGVPSRKTAAGKRPLHRLPKVETAHVPTKSNKSPRLTSSPHPTLLNRAAADELKQLLLDLSKDPKYSTHRSTLRIAADQVRIAAFGHNRQATKRRVMKLLEEFHCLEIEDLIDETRIDEREIKSALIELVEEGRVKEGKRRRWQEPGKHYNPLFEIA